MEWDKRMKVETSYREVARQRASNLEGAGSFVIGALPKAGYVFEWELPEHVAVTLPRVLRS
jgi:hypothetical protein